VHPLSYSISPDRKNRTGIQNKILTIKVNVDKKQHLAAQYQVSGIPTIMMFNKGEPIMRLTGALPYEQIKSSVDNALKNL
jgi:thioredoxin-like negative regulator of GroEL